MNYSLDELIKVFTLHSEQFIKISEEKKSEFNISRALLTICKEIKRLDGWTIE